MFGKYVVHMVLDGVSGRDIADTYGLPRQQEVLFLPGSKYVVNSVSVANDGHPIIFVKEVVNNEIQDSNRDMEGRKSELARNERHDVEVPRGEGYVNRGVHGNRGGAENVEDVRGRQIHDASHLESERLDKASETVSKAETESISDEENVQEQSREYLGEEQEQQRTDTLTNREVLEMAANEVKVSDLTQAENDALTIFQDRLSKLKILQDERAEQGRIYKEQQFGTKPDREAASATLNCMHVLDEQIKKATANVLTVEEKEVLKQVLTKARKVVEAEERQHGQEILNRWRERRNNAAAIKKYRDRLRGDVDELTNWIVSPDNKDIVKHVPDVLKNSVIPFLSSINFMSKRSLKGGNATV